MENKTQSLGSEIEKILIDIGILTEQEIKEATSSLTALIIKWLEGKRVVVIEHYYGNSENTSNVGRNQLITELVEEMR
jgi:hypothetical protein